MAYNILLIEKPEEYYYGDYKTIEKFVDAMIGLLRVEGHNVLFRKDLESTTEKEYMDSDCVFAHPAPHQFRRLKELSDKYPHVGLIVTPGDVRTEECHTLFKDGAGTYVLEKPFTAEEFLRTIDVVIGGKSINRE